MSVVGAIGEPLVVVGCSRRKTATDVPIPALDLYQGGRVPALRKRVAGRSDLRDRVWIISAEHGLVHADTPMLPYDRRMDADRARDLRAQVQRTARRALPRRGSPREVLVVAEPVYMLALADLPDVLGPSPIHWIDDPVGSWEQADRILTTWSWPCP